MMFPNGERVRVTDVAPRDGLQNEAGVVSSEDKARLVSALASAGVDEVEVSSFVSPKWVPQLADAVEVFERVAGVLGSGSAVPVLSALVPNERGFERALRVHRILGERGLGGLKASFFTAASEAFSQKNTNASIGESVDRFGSFAHRALGEGMALRVYVSCVVACPIAGPIEAGAVSRVVSMVEDLFADGERERVEIDLGDTIGVARPEEIGAAVDAVASGSGEGVLGRLTLHLHDTFGRAGACVLAGLERGVRSFDGAAGGLGGCPYATGSDGARAPGNISTEHLVEVIEGAGYGTGVDRARLADAGALARELVGREAGAMDG